MILQNRLAAICAQHPPPALTIFKPTPAHSRWRAFIAGGTVPGDAREMVITDPDYEAFVGKLDELFAGRGPPG